MSLDPFAQFQPELAAPGSGHYPVTPSNTTDFPIAFRAIWVGGAGDVAIVANGDTTAVVYVGALAGSIIPMRGKRVNVTGTTATNLVGMY